MEQWVQLLLQWAVPVFTALVNAKARGGLGSGVFLTQKQLPGQRILEFLEVGSSVILSREQQARQEERAATQFQHINNIRSFIQTVAGASDFTEPDLQHQQLRHEQMLQQHSLAYQRETLLKLATYQRETALRLPEIHKILDHWPLRLLPVQLLETRSESDPIPLRIFLAPPVVQFEQHREPIRTNIPGLELGLAQKLREFLSQHYPLSSSARPTEFLGGAWDSKRFHGECSIKTLFGMLRSEPTLILESEIDGDTLNFRLAYWGPGQATYCYRTIFRLSYQEFLAESARVRALKWKETRSKLLALGRNPKEIDHLGGNSALNLALLEEVEALHQAGIETQELGLEYRIDKYDRQTLCEFLGTCHCLVAGWVADIHHLIYQDASPILPVLLPQLVKDVSDPTLVQGVNQATVAIYQDLLSLLAAERVCQAPELALKFAQSLIHLPDPGWARAHLDYSLQTWLQQRQPLQATGLSALEVMQSVLTVKDQDYLRALKACLAALGDEAGVTQVQALLGAIANQHPQQQFSNASLAHTVTDFSGPVKAIAISAEHCTLVSDRGNNTVELWSMDRQETWSGQKPRLTHTLTRHTGQGLTFALSNDGQTLVGSDLAKHRSHIRVWDLNTGKLRRTLFGHKKPILALAIAPNGKTLASGSHKIKIWDLYTGEPLRMLFGHREQVYAIAISPDSRTLISGSADKTVRIWNLRTAELLRTLNGHQDAVRAVAVSPDGQTIASGGADHQILLWNLRPGQRLHTLAGHTGLVNAITFSPDGQGLLTASADQTIRVWDVQTGNLLQTLAAHKAAVGAIAISTDGQTLLSGSADRTLKIWQAV